MMAAFNVSSLSDWGYPETTKFLDPMEQRWRSKKYDDSKFKEAYIMNELLPSFSGLDAYAGHDDVEDALVDYYKTRSLSTAAPSSTSSTIAVTSTTSTATTKSSTLLTVTTKATTTTAATSSTAKATTTSKKKD